MPGRKARSAYVLLGDFVGYGADPVWTVGKVMELVERGAIAVLGNHDAAVGSPTERMHEEAMKAIDWTRGELGVEARRFLASLPLTDAGPASSTCMATPARRKGGFTC